MATIETMLEGITLNPIQAAFPPRTERFGFYVGDVGAGKTCEEKVHQRREGAILSCRAESDGKEALPIRYDTVRFLWYANVE